MPTTIRWWTSSTSLMSITLQSSNYVYAKNWRWNVALILKDIPVASKLRRKKRTWSRGILRNIWIYIITNYVLFRAIPQSSVMRVTVEWVHVRVTVTLIAIIVVGIACMLVLIAAILTQLCVLLISTVCGTSWSTSLSNSCPVSVQEKKVQQWRGHCTRNSLEKQKCAQRDILVRHKKCILSSPQHPSVGIYMCA